MTNISAVSEPARNPEGGNAARPLTSFADVAALVEEELRAVEARLAERLESPIGAIPQVGAHLLGAGGKRLRPLLAVLAARASGAPRSRTGSPSAAPPS